MKVALHFYLLFASEPFANILGSVHQAYNLGNFMEINVSLQFYSI